MIRKSFLIEGKVQGVGFRFFCQYIASKLSLTGYARNLDNGNVLVEIQGSEKNIATFKSSILKGNGFCKVTNINEETLQVQEKEHRLYIY